MAGGSPFEIYRIFGLQIPRYKVTSVTQVALYVMGIYTGGAVLYSNLGRKTVETTFESKEEEMYVQKYIQHAEKELEKPVLLRTRYQGTV